MSIYQCTPIFCNVSVVCNRSICLSISVTHLCPFSKSKFNLYEALSLTTSTLLHRLVLSIKLSTVQTRIGKVDPARKFKCTTAARNFASIFCNVCVCNRSICLSVSVHISTVMSVFVIDLSVYLSVYIYLLQCRCNRFICLSISVHISTVMSVFVIDLSAYLSVYIYLSIYQCTSIFCNVCVCNISICLSISVHLSTEMSVFVTDLSVYLCVCSPKVQSPLE